VRPTGAHLLSLRSRSVPSRGAWDYQRVKLAPNCSCEAFEDPVTGQGLVQWNVGLCTPSAAAVCEEFAMARACWPVCRPRWDAGATRRGFDILRARLLNAAQ